jgi:hypothetical protein
MEQARNAALIVAGAAARGAFAAGALSVLAADRRVRVTRVIGASGGALNAAVYAAGLRAGEADAAAQLLQHLWTHEASWGPMLSARARKRVVKGALASFRSRPSTLAAELQLNIVVSTIPGARGLNGPVGSTAFEETLAVDGHDLSRDAAIDAIADFALAAAEGSGRLLDSGVARRRCSAASGLAAHPPSPASDRAAIAHVVVISSEPQDHPGPTFHMAREECLFHDIRGVAAIDSQTRARRVVSLDPPCDGARYHLVELIQIRPDRPLERWSSLLNKSARREQLEQGRRAAERALRDWRGAPIVSTTRTSRRPALRLVAAVPSFSTRAPRHGSNASS